MIAPCVIQYHKMVEYCTNLYSIDFWLHIVLMYCLILTNPNKSARSFDSPTRQGSQRFPVKIAYDSAFFPNLDF